MEDAKKEEVLVEKKVRNRHKFRDTVLIRVDRGIKEEVKELSKENGCTMAWINDNALRDYLEAVKSSV